MNQRGNTDHFADAIATDPSPDHDSRSGCSIRLRAALIRPMWEKACGKLPSLQPSTARLRWWCRGQRARRASIGGARWFASAINVAAGPRGAPRERVADHTVEHHVEGPEHLDVIGAVARDAEPADTIKLLRRDVDERVAGLVLTTVTSAPHPCNRRAPTNAPPPLPPGPVSTTTRRPSRVAAEEANPGELCEVAARGLRHLGKPDSEVVDHDPVDLDHLCSGQPGQRRWRAREGSPFTARGSIRPRRTM